jgi:hypothetical protein
MNPRRAVALALLSMLALAALIVSGAMWFIVTMNGVFLLVPWWLSHFREIPWNPVAILATFNSIVVILLMLPWAALCAWSYWIVEGAWLDLLDPNGRIATDAPRLNQK